MDAHLTDTPGVRPDLHVIEGFPLSVQQARAWSAYRAGEVVESSFAFAAAGALDRSRLRLAVERVAGRFEILRTTFAELAGVKLPLQVIAPAPVLAWTEEDWSGIPPAEQERLVRARVAAHPGSATFDRLPLASYSAIALGDARYLLLVRMPVVIADAASGPVLLRRVAEAYAGGADDGSDDAQYADYASWQAEVIERDAQASAFGAIPPVAPSALPLWEHPLPAAPDAIVRTLDSWTTSSLAAMAAVHDVSLESILIAAWQVLIHRLTGRDEIGLAVLHDGRALEQVRDSVGLFARYLPIEARIASDAPVHDVLRNVDRVWRAHDRDQDRFSWDDWLAAAQLPRETCPATCFDFHRWPEPIEAGGVRWSLHSRWSAVDRFALRLTCEWKTDGAELRWECQPSGSAERLARLADAFDAAIAAIAPGANLTVASVPCMGAAERRQVTLELARGPEAALRDSLPEDLFARQAARTPDAAAVSSPGSQVTYAELDRRANQVARALQSLGVGRGTVVALCVERSVDAIAALLGIWKAGAAYAPLDPTHPRQRLEALLEDLSSPVLVTQRNLSPPSAGSEIRILHLDDDEIVRQECAPVVSRASHDDLAYVLYTSGSTGQPKGVMVTRGAVVNLWQALGAAVYGDEPGALRVAVNAPLVFDASVKQVVQLLSGHCLELVPEEVRPSGPALREYVERVRADVLDGTPTQVRRMVEGRSEALAVGRVLVGGEAIDAALWARLRAMRGPTFYNVYGPTECTVDVTVQRVTAGAAPPDSGSAGEGSTPVIGRPLANVTVYVLDEGLAPVPVGVVGRVYVGGAGVARGYWGEAARTAAVFVPDPYGGRPGARLYDTGDRGRWLADGTLEFRGRADRQLKVGGVRIEPAEIEDGVRRHSGVRDVVVTLRSEPSGQMPLVAYVVPKLRRPAPPPGARVYRLPSGVEIVHQNRHETEYLYDEIFIKRAYLRHGIELPERACIFDVGANIGMFTLFAYQECPGATIVAFEPIPPLFDALAANVAAWDARVTLVRAGVSDQARQEAFTFYPHYSMMSGARRAQDPESDLGVIRRYLDNQQRAGGDGAAALRERADELLEGRFEARTYECPLVRLSDVIRERKIERIDLLKIDVQRLEQSVLDGIDPVDWPRIQQVAAEVHDDPARPTAGGVAAMLERLRAHGFDAVVEQDPMLEGTDRYGVYARRTSAASKRGASHRAPARVEPIASAAVLQQHLRDWLPPALVPSHVVLLDALPLTPRGKVDTAALPAPGDAGRRGAEPLAPRNRLEQQIATVWQTVLKLETVGVDQNFFDLGGHSLLLVELHAKLREALGRDLSIVEIFQHPTVAALASHLEGRAATSSSLEAARRRGQRQHEALHRIQS